MGDVENVNQYSPDIIGGCLPILNDLLLFHISQLWTTEQDTAHCLVLIIAGNVFHTSLPNNSISTPSIEQAGRYNCYMFF